MRVDALKHFEHRTVSHILAFRFHSLQSTATSNVEKLIQHIDITHTHLLRWIFKQCIRKSRRGKLNANM